MSPTPESAEEVVRRVQSPVWHYLIRRADADEAADAMSDTLVTLWRRMADLPEDPIPYAIGVARKCLANRRRAGRRREALVARLTLLDPPTPTAAPAEPEEYDALNLALATLCDNDRELIRLWAWDQVEPHEIATVLGLTANAARVRLHRARTRLRSAYDVMPGDEPDTTPTTGGHP